MHTTFVWLTLLSNLFLTSDHIVSLMYRKKVITTSLAILAIVTAVSLVTASSGSGLVTFAFAVKKGASVTTTGTSSSKKDTSGQVVLAQVRRASLSNVLQQYPEVFQGLT
jgi:hypothetical protein